MTRRRVLTHITVFLIGLALGGALVRREAPMAFGARAFAQAGNEAAPVSAPPTLGQEIEAIKGMLPDQSSAMADVSYHFSNLWFAAQKKNWPLAEFYLSETRSHLKWAVRIKPIRKDPEGRDLDMPAILQPVDESLLQPLLETIHAKDLKRFNEGYRLSLERGCYACHKTSGKPYLRPRVPEAPPQPIINFDPAAKWPE